MRGPFVAMVCAAALALAAPSRAHAQEAAAFAQQRFALGVGRYHAGDYAAALDEFQASLGLYNSPNSRLFEARCLRRIGRLGAAFAEYERAAHEARDLAATDPHYAMTAQTAALEREALAPLVGWLTIPPGAPADVTTIRVDGRVVPRAALGLPIAITPGSVRVEVARRDRAPELRVIAVAAGERAALDVWAPTVAPSPVRVVRVDATRGAVAWGLVATGGAAVLTGAALWVAALVDHGALVTACPARCPDATHEGLLDAGQAFETTGWVVAGVGVAALAVGAVLSHAAAVPRRAGLPVVAPRIALGALGLEGRF